MAVKKRATIVIEDFLRKAAKNSLFKIKCIVYWQRIVKTQKQWKSTYEKLMKLKQTILDRLNSGIQLLLRIHDGSKSKKLQKNFKIAHLMSNLTPEVK